MAMRERYVWICTNRRPDGHPRGSCAEKGSEALLVTLKSAVSAAGLARTVRVMSSSCIDVCEDGCALAVLPDGTMLGGVTEADVEALVEGLRRPGGVAEQPTLAPRVLPRP
jgi:(2Fe-2S) ferredoxin